MEYRVAPDRQYTTSHEWVKMEDDIAVVGVTDYAQHQLSDLVYIELPVIGEQVAKGATLTTLESVKAVGEVYAPVTGEVVDANISLAEQPELVNADPYGAGWLAKIRPSNLEELNELMDAAAYAEMLGTIS